MEPIQTKIKKRFKALASRLNRIILGKGGDFDVDKITNIRHLVLNIEQWMLKAKSFSKTLLLVLVLIFLISPFKTRAAGMDLSMFVMDKESSKPLEGNQIVVFTIYEGENGKKVWSESQKVDVNYGLLKTSLGKRKDLPEDLDPSANDYFLGIKIGGDRELTPRKRISPNPFAVSAIYAQEAKTLEGSQVGEEEGDIMLLGSGGKVDNDFLNTGEGDDELVLGGDERLHDQNSDTGTDSLTFDLGSDLGLSSGSNFDFRVSSASHKPALRYNSSSNVWQISNDGSVFGDLVTGSSLSDSIEDIESQLAQKSDINHVHESGDLPLSTLSGDLLPNLTDTYDVGSIEKRWAEVNTKLLRAETMIIEESATLGSLGENIVFNSSLVPSSNGINLGSVDNPWANLYVDNITVASTNTAGTASSHFSINTAGADGDDSGVRFYRGPTINGYATLEWDESEEEFNFYKREDLAQLADLNIKVVNATQIRASGSGGLLLSDDGDNGVFVEDGGNVGIGTADPQSILHINGGTGSLATGIAFGDGDSGIYEVADDQIVAKINGINKFRLTDSFFDFYSNGEARIKKINASATDPTYVMNGLDSDTGLGSAGTDKVSLIAGGSEIARATEDTTEQFILNPQADLTGTAAAPSLAFGDGDSGIYESDDDDLSISLNGAEIARFRLTGSTDGSLYMNQFSTGDTADGYPAYAFLGDMNTGMYSRSSDVLGFSTGGNSRMIIDNSGNVGIGTTSPNQQLDIQKIDDAGSMTLSRAESDNILGIGDDIGQLLFESNAGDATRGIFAKILVEADGSATSVNDYPGKISFYTTANGSGVPAARMTIKSDGNVGIGTVIPGTVVPNGFATTLSKVLEIRADSSSRDSGIFIRDADGSPGLDLWSDGSEKNTYIDSRDSSDNTNGLFFRVKTDATPVNAMFIQNSGNVGIGTTSPSSALDIVGDLEVGGSDFFVDDSSGFVGIGTDSPSSKFHVEGDMMTNGILHVAQDGSTYSTSTIQFNSTISNTNARFPSGKIYTKFDGISYDDARLTLAYPINASTWADGLSLKNGNIGIGTTSPNQQLQITGNFELPNTTFADQSGVIYKNGVPFIHNFNYGDNGTVTTAGGNLFVGENAGNLTMGSTATSDSHSSYNVGIGKYSLYLNTTGFANVAMGHTALTSNTTGNNNVGLGYRSLYANTEGNANTSVGTHSLVGNTTGSSNTAMGYSSLFSNTGGLNNTAVGYQSLNNNTTGSSNTGLGYRALRSNTTGGYNVAVGLSSLGSNTTGASNAALGYGAGNMIADGTTPNEISTNSLYLGADTKALADGDENEIVIGYNATGVGSNSVVLGNDSVTKTVLKGNVGIGTTSPSSKLHVNSGGGNIVSKFESTDAGARIMISDNNADSYFGTNGISSFFGLYDDGSDTRNLYVTSSGKVGIGTTSPSSALDIVGDLEVGGSDFFVDDSSGFVGIGTASPGYKLHVDAGLGTLIKFERDTSDISNINGVVDYKVTSTGNMVDGFGTGFTGSIEDVAGVENRIGRLSFIRDGADNEGAMTFSAGTNGLEEFMRIDSSGNVGIGTTSPLSKLHINGGTGSLATGLTFGDGDTGFYESSDDYFVLKTDNIVRWRFTDRYFGSADSGEAALVKESPSGTNPVILPKQADLDTGIGRADDDVLSLIAGGVNGLNVNGSGKVGIGTTSPSSKLHVTSAVNGDTAIFGSSAIAGAEDNIGVSGYARSNTAGASAYGVKAEAVAKYTTSEDIRALYVTTSYELSDPSRKYGIYQDGTGNIANYFQNRVGIGTDSPSELLQLQGDSKYLSILASDGSEGVRLGTSSAGKGLFYLRDASGSNQIYLEADGNSYFKSGNIGIGTTTPTAQLHTQGNLTTSLTGTVATTNASATVTGTGTAFDTELAAGDAIKIGSEIFTIASISSATSLTLDSNSTVTASGVTAYSDPNLFAIDDGDGTNQFIVDKSGNVGIGTTSPDGLLHISGTPTPGGLSEGLVFGDGDAGFYEWNDDNLVMEAGGGVSIRIGSTFRGQFYNSGFRAGSNSNSAGIQTGASTATVPRINPDMTDLDTGIGKADTDILSLIAGGVNGLNVNGSGKVGIGTTSPQGNLDIYGSEPSLFLTNNNSNDWKIVNLGTDNTLRFQYNLSSKMTMDSSGNIGIGTTVPGDKLTVLGGNIIVREDDNGNDAVRLTSGSAAGQMQLLRDGSTVVELNGGDGTASYINNGGNVGIGTSSPEKELHVYRNAESLVRVTSAIDNIAGIDFGDVSDSDIGYIRYYNTDNSLRLRANNSDPNLVINSSGNVGIGTTSPDAPLHIAAPGDSSFVKIQPTSVGYSAFSFHSSTGLRKTLFGYNESESRGFFQVENSERFDILTGGTETLSLHGNGNVGIGTTNPSYTLDVNGTGHIGGTLYVGGGSLGMTADTKMQRTTSDGSDDGYITIKGGGGSAFEQWRGGEITVFGNEHANAGAVYIESGSSGGGIYLKENNEDVLVINSSGNVGIGTTSPTQKLEVSGNTLSTRFRAAAAAGSSEPAYNFDTDTNTGIFQAGADGLGFSTGGSEQMRIDSSGKVGIGTTSPLAKLEIREDTDSYAETLLYVAQNPVTTPGSVRTMWVRGETTAESLRVDNEGGGYAALFMDGNVGIGTASPSYQLEVAGGDSALFLNDGTVSMLFDPDGNSGMGLVSVGSSLRIKLDDNSDNGNSVFDITDDSDNVRFLVEETGNVGIGTASPTDKLTVLATGNAIARFDTTAIDYGRILVNAPTNSDSQISFMEDASTKWSIGNDGSDGDKFKIRTGVGAFGTNDRFAIDSSGNIGIGTANPQTILHVDGISSDTISETTAIAQIEGSGGNGLALGTLASSPYQSWIQSGFVNDLSTATYSLSLNPLGGNVGIGTTSPGDKLTVGETTDGFNAMRIQSTNTGIGEIRFADSDDVNVGFLKYNHNGNVFSINVNDSEAMRILSSGNVGIGTTSPAYTLDVNGTFNVNNNNILLTGTLGNTIIQGNGATLEFTRAGSNFIRASDASGSLNFDTGGSNTRMRIDSSGNIGIGTTSPSAIMDIEKAFTEAGQTAVEITTSGENSSALLHLNASATIAGGSKFISATDGGTGVFHVTGVGSGYFAGNVGIGTTSPGANFHVNRSGGIINSIFQSDQTTSRISFRDSNSTDNARAGIGSAGNELTLFSNGAEAVRVDSSGNVGIGTASPDTRFHALTSSSTNVGIFESIDASNDAWLWLVNPASRTAGGYNDVGLGAIDRNLIIRAGDTSRFTVQGTTGNVGIGTTSPESKLHLSAIGDNEIILEADSDNNGEDDNPTIIFRQDGNLVNGLVGLGDGSAPRFSGTLSNALYLESKDTGVGGGIQFVTGDRTIGGTGGSARMTITMDGNVGIGTVSPNVALQIGETDTTDSPVLRITGNGTGSYEGGEIQLEMAADHDTTYDHWRMDTYTDDLRFGPSGSTHVTFKDNGNVGIGTTSPGGKLDISGGDIIISTDTRGIHTGTSDGTDNHTLKIGGGGNFSSSRGALLILEGNEAGGDVQINPGDATGDKVSIDNTLRILDGRVGIGIDSPASILEISSNGTTVPRITSADGLGDAMQRFYSNTTYKGQIGWDQSADVLGIYGSATSGTPSVSINSSNNMGIGTTSPSATLDIVGGTANDVIMSLSDIITNATNKTVRLGTKHYTNTEEDAALLYTANTSTDNVINMGGGTSLFNAATRIAFFTGATNTTTTGTERMRIDESGNVGIGDSSPSYILTVDHNGDGTDVAYVNDSNAWTSGSADYAEYYHTKDTDLKPGEAVCIDIGEENAVERCRRDGDSNIMGIVSTSPAFLGNAPAEERREDNENYKVIAMLGQVPAKVSTENGDINSGDSLSAGETPGTLRKSNPGESTVGVALESISDERGIINVLISRKNKSLTVSEIEEKVAERVAGMEIEDEVDLLVQDAISNLDIENLLVSFEERILTLEENDQSQIILNHSSQIQNLDSQISSANEYLEELTETLEQTNDLVDYLTEKTLERETRIQLLEEQVAYLTERTISDEQLEKDKIEFSSILEKENSQTLGALATNLEYTSQGDVFTFNINGELEVSTVKAEKGEFEEVVTAGVQLEVKSEDEVDECNEDSEGAIYYSKKEKSFMGCNGSEWKKIDFAE